MGSKILFFIRRHSPCFGVDLEQWYQPIKGWIRYNIKTQLRNMDSDGKQSELGVKRQVEWDFQEEAEQDENKG